MIRTSPIPTANDIARSLTGHRHISYTQVKTYQACPLRWHFQYVRAAPMEHISGAMLLGSCVHAAIQYRLQRLLAADAMPDLEELMWVYRHQWATQSADITVLYAKGQERATMEDLARRMVRQFVSSEFASPNSQIIGVEEPFLVSLAPDLPDLAGRVDLITGANGELLVTDFKTARSIPTQETVEYQFEQLVLYAEGCRPIARALEARRIRARFVFISKVKEPRVEAFEVPLGPERLRQSRTVTQGVFRAMRAGVVYPSPSPMACGGCPYRQACSKWQHGNAM